VSRGRDCARGTVGLAVGALTRLFVQQHRTRLLHKQALRL
jgi:hypothetical protein